MIGCYKAVTPLPPFREPPEPPGELANIRMPIPLNCSTGGLAGGSKMRLWLSKQQQPLPE